MGSPQPRVQIRVLCLSLFAKKKGGMKDALPIDEVIEELVAAVRDRGCAVLQAPPGAGKTTRVPLALLETGIVQGKIVMLEPRRLAARAAAVRLAQQLAKPQAKPWAKPWDTGCAVTPRFPVRPKLKS